LIEGACRTYAQEPVYTYRCNGIWPLCGLNEWMEVTGVRTDQSAFNACIAYAKAGAVLAGRQVEKRDGIYRSTWQDVDRMNAQIAQGYAQVQDLRKRYEAAQRQYEEAKAQGIELERRIADLESQGVFC
jgi:chromosome segregation ATPase